MDQPSTITTADLPAGRHAVPGAPPAALPRPPVPPPVLPDLWNRYFAGRHAEVLGGANAALKAGQAADLLHLCGLSMLAQGRIAEAVPALRVSLSLCPHAASWFSNCAIAALDAGAPAVALDFAQDGLVRHDHPVLHFVRGNALLGCGRPAEAQAAFRRALLLRPDFADAAVSLGHALRRTGDVDAALAHYALVLNNDPNHGGAMLGRAGVLADLGRFDEASLLLLRLLATRDSPEASALLDALRSRTATPPSP